MRLLLSLVLYAVVMSSTEMAAASPAGGSKLRPQDDRLTQLILAGVERSATLKSLVDRIEASRVIVYVAINPLMKPNLSGMLTWMTQAGGYRYVRVSISTRPDARSDDRHDRPRAAACGGSNRRRSRQRRREPGGALSSHRPAEWQRVAIALGNRRRPANRVRGQKRARQCAGHQNRASGCGGAFVTEEFVPVMLCPASGLSHRPPPGLPDTPHVRGLLRIRSAPFQSYA